MNRKLWGTAAATAAYGLAVISVWSSGVCMVSGPSGLYPFCEGAFLFCFLAWPILAFVAVRIWITKRNTETSEENGTRFGRFIIIIFAIVAACIVWLGQLTISSRLYPSIKTQNSLDLFLAEVAVTVLGGLVVGVWKK